MARWRAQRVHKATLDGGASDVLQGTREIQPDQEIPVDFQVVRFQSKPAPIFLLSVQVVLF